MGLTAAEGTTAANVSMTMPKIENGSAQIPLYIADQTKTTVAEAFQAYNGNDVLTTVSIVITKSTDGKFTQANATTFMTDFTALVQNNTANTNFTPTASGGNITVDFSEAGSISDMANLPTKKWMLVTAAP